VDPPSLTVTPNTGLVDGQTVSFTTNVTSPAEVSICDAALTSNLSLNGLIDNCWVPTSSFNGPTGSFVVHQTFSAALGRQVDCGLPTSCVLAVVNQDGFNEIATAPISFVAQPFVVAPTTDLVDGQTVDAWITATAGSTQQVAQCALPIGTSLATTACGSATSVVVPASGFAHLTPTVATTLTTAGGPVDCSGSVCAFVQFDAGGTTVASVPIGARVVPDMTISPSTGLVDGQTINVHATHLPPGESIELSRCQIQLGGVCEPVVGSIQTVPADGTIDTTVPASQRFLFPIGTKNNLQYPLCRLDTCSLAMSIVGVSGVAGELTYTMAAGSLTATPSTGLPDGQSVALSATGIMSTYVGPSFGPFGTGGWAVAECRADIGSSPSLLQAFQGCGFPGGAGVATIPGSTYSTIVQPTATLTAILGATTDCRAAAGTCVVGLVRFEQDGTMSTHLAPLTFAP
jgi:hypothetical protein